LKFSFGHHFKKRKKADIFAVCINNRTPFVVHVAVFNAPGFEDLLPSLQTSMMYPSRPDAPTTAGWLQMMVTEVSFLSSMNTSSGALVGSADAAKKKEQLNYSKKWQKRSKLFSIGRKGQGS